MSPDKGAHRAVEVAEATGLPLKLAGKMQELLEEEYFDSQVRPHLGPEIEYLGEVSHDGEGRPATERPRDPLPDRVGGAVRARHDRVDGLRDARDRHAPGRGAGGVEDGRSGIIVDDHTRDGLGALRSPTGSIPSECRRYVEERFSAERMVSDYEAAYTAMIERPPGYWRLPKKTSA